MGRLIKALPLSTNKMEVSTANLAIAATLVTIGRRKAG